MCVCVCVNAGCILLLISCTLETNNVNIWVGLHVLLDITFILC